MAYETKVILTAIGELIRKSVNAEGVVLRPFHEPSNEKKETNEK